MTRGCTASSEAGPNTLEIIALAKSCRRPRIYITSWLLVSRAVARRVFPAPFKHASGLCPTCFMEPTLSLLYFPDSLSRACHSVLLQGSMETRTQPRWTYARCRTGQGRTPPISITDTRLGWVDVPEDDVRLAVKHFPSRTLFQWPMCRVPDMLLLSVLHCIDHAFPVILSLQRPFWQS
ncbi:hypothetical protein LZ31DRAFT_287773 [Colletotrichum somersetense]|nr:hypothetical protein LZ31DRAFT_287773 [Colletotrichum somersetense]